MPYPSSLQTLSRGLSPSLLPLWRRGKDLVSVAPVWSQASPSFGLAALYQSFIEHVMALRSLQREHKKHLEREKALGDILDNLRTGYNPNYQDMAVLEAVRGWEHLAGLPHINDVAKDDDDEAELGSDDAVVEEEEEELEEGMWSELQLETMLDDLLETDYEGLLIEHDRFVGAPASPTSICECVHFIYCLRSDSPNSVVYNLSAYLPDALVPQFEAFRDQLVSVLGVIGLAKPAADAGAGELQCGITPSVCS